MKAFLASVVVAVVIAAGAAVLLEQLPHDSAQTHVSPTADVRL